MMHLPLIIGLVVGVVAVLIALAAVLPCEGCRLRRERIARGLARLRAKEHQQDETLLNRD